MTRRTRRNEAPAFGAKVALADRNGGQKLAVLAQLYDRHPNQITIWKPHLAEGAAGCLPGRPNKPGHAIDRLSSAHRKSFSPIPFSRSAE